MEFSTESNGSVDQSAQNIEQSNVSQGVQESTQSSDVQVQHGQEQNTQPQVEGNQEVSGIDTSFAEYFDNIPQPQQNFNPQQFGYQQQPQQFQPAYPLQAVNPQQFNYQPQPQQPVQAQQPQQQIEPPQPIQIDYEKMSTYLDEGDAKSFIDEINNLITGKAEELFNAKQQDLTSNVDKTIQQRLDEQQYLQTVNTMTNHIISGLEKSNVSLSKPELEVLGNQIEAEYHDGSAYNQYNYQFNALKATGQLNSVNIPKGRNGRPLSKDEFYSNLAIMRVVKDKNVNQPIRTPNNVVRQTMNPVIPTGSNVNQAIANQKSDADHIAEWDGI